MSHSAPTPTARAAVQQNSHGILQFLQQYPPFNHMEQAHLMLFIEHAWLHFYSAGTVVTQPKDGVPNHWFLIRQGLVTRRYKNPVNDQEVDELLLSAGDTFPTDALLNERATQNTYTATEDTFCIVIDTATFTQLLQLSSPFRVFAIRGVSALLGSLQREVQAQANLSLGAQYSLNAKLSTFASRAPVTCSSDTTLREAVQRMHKHQVGSIVVVDENNAPTGIFTLRDLRRVISRDVAELDCPMALISTADPLTLAPKATAFDAALLMAQHHIGHLCIVRDKHLVGVVSERDLFALQRVDLVHLARALRQADRIETINTLREDMHRLVDNMLAHGADASQITQVITQLNDHTTTRVIELALKQAGHPDIAFNWLVFGSEARGEQGLFTDQDNGILFHADTPEQADAIRSQLLPIAQSINQSLDRCGLTLCKGNVMAGNPRLCLSLQEWEQRFDEILHTPDPKRILQASVFFDLRVLWGPDLGFDALHQRVLKRVANRPSFQRLLARAALHYPPPPSQLRMLIAKAMGSTPFELPLKRHGLAPFVDATRVLALAAQISAAGTQERLEILAEKRLIKAEDATAWAEAYRYLQLMRLQLHQRQARHDRPLTNTLRLTELNELHRRMLREALRQVRYAQALLRFRYRL